MPDSSKRFLLAFRLAGGLFLLALAGYTQTLSARVNTVQQWPANAVGASYRFEAADPAQAQSLEYQTYQDMIRAAIGATGLVETQDVATARFTVSFSYGTERTRVTTARRDPFFDPYYDFPGGPFIGAGRAWGGGHYGGIGYYRGGWVPVEVEAYRNTLTVEIRDAERNGAQVYRSTAVAMGGADSLAQAMPYLVRTVFDGFPANNGEVREARYRD